MKIKAKSIRTIDKIVKISAGLEEVILGLKVSDTSTAHLVELGFPESLPEGVSIIPAALGKYTTFNARGREEKRPDLPLETYHVTYTSTTYDWHRNPHYGSKTRSGKRIARVYIEAPSVYLSIAIINEEKYIITPLLKLSEGNSEYNIHVVNLMLECFGEFEILDKNKTPLKTKKFKKLQWDILPKGVYPWEKVASMIKSGTHRLTKDESEIIQERLKLINVYKPDFIGVGQGGFNGYFVFGFESKSTYILESAYLDNATYVFKKDWEHLSKLTKNEIINNDIEHQRVIHDKKWKQAIGIVITKAKK